MNLSVRRILELLAEAQPDGLQPAEVVRQLGLPRDARPRVRRLLLDLVRGGLVEQAGRRFRCDAAQAAADHVVGQLHVVPRGHGYVDLSDGSGESVRVGAGDVGGAIDGDTVELEVYRSRRRLRGHVRAIQRRGRRRIVGTLDGPPWRLEPLDRRITRVVEVEGGGPELAREVGQQALAEIGEYPAAAGEPLRARIEAFLAEQSELAAELRRLLWEHDCSESFPAAVELEAAAAPDRVRPRDRLGRRDLRQLPWLTIDPATARDFDDAVTATPGPQRTQVRVAVADVSHYVAEDSALDLEARLRGCSVYLPGRALPMLPERLSGGICSLRPDRDRLALVVRFEVDRAGRVSREEIAQAVIRSRARFDYDGVAAALQGTLRGGRARRYLEHLEQLELLAEVARRLRGRRRSRGSLLDLDLPEAQVVLDEDDPARVRTVVARRRDAARRGAYQLIEELMIAANEAVARAFAAADVATIWRVHGAPRVPAAEQLADQLAAHGIAVAAESLVEPRGVSRLLSSPEMRTHPARRALSYLVLRSLQQAEYRAVQRGHFGLASTAYLHFTSPIRRYPDLHVHRLVKRRLLAAADEAPAVRQHRASELAPLAEEASSCERRALEVERAVHALYSAQLMRDRVGDSFDGAIIGVASIGVFVALDDPFVEGLVRADGLPEPTVLDERRLRLVAPSGRTLSLGDPVRVRVTRVDVVRRQIDLQLLEHDGRPWHGHGPARRRGGERRRHGGRGRERRRQGPRRSRRR